MFGVGRGYHTREVETFGSPLLDQEANRELARLSQLDGLTGVANSHTPQRPSGTSKRRDGASDSWTSW